MESNDIRFIKNEIDLILLNSNGRTLRDKIQDYIKSHLSIMVDEGLFNMESILYILQEIYEPILIDMNKDYIDGYFDCWVFLAYCVKIGNDFSIFDPNIKENIKHRKGYNERYIGTKGFSRIYNTLNGRKINIMRKKLKIILEQNDNSLIKLLGKGFDPYVNTFNLNLKQNIKAFRRLINNLIKSPNIVSTEINIINFIRKYGKGKASFTTDEFGNPYKVSYADGDHSFTFLFESLYEKIMDGKHYKLTTYKKSNTSAKFPINSQQIMINKPENIVQSNEIVNVQPSTIVNNSIEKFPTIAKSAKMRRNNIQTGINKHKQNVAADQAAAKAAAKALKNAKSSQLNP